MVETDTGLRIRPQAGWAYRAPMADDETADEIRGERLVARLRARLDGRRQLVALLGMIYRDTTMLPVLGGGVLGPARTPEGRDMKWYLWSPSRRVLIDVFRRMPPDAELHARDAFARAHEIRYAVVPPDRQLTVKSLTEWLTP